MAEFTGAQDRVALSKKSRKEEERKRAKGIVEMIEDAYVPSLCSSLLLF